MRRGAEERQMVSLARGELNALHKRVEQLEEENVQLRAAGGRAGSLATRHSLCLAEQLIRLRRALRHQHKTALATEQAGLKITDHVLDLEKMLENFPKDAEQALAALRSHHSAVKAVARQMQKEGLEAGFHCVAGLRSSQNEDLAAAKEATLEQIEELSLKAGALLECSEIPADLRDAFYLLLDFSLQLSEKVDRPDKSKFRAKLQPFLAEFNEHLRVQVRRLGARALPAQAERLPGPVYLKCELRNLAQPNLLALSLAQGAGGGGGEEASAKARKGLCRLEEGVSAALEVAEELKNIVTGTGRSLVTANLLARLFGQLHSLKQAALQTASEL